MALGKQIRLLRIRRGLTVVQLAEISGVDSGTISALENRDSKRSEYTAAIAAALGVPMNVLVEGDSELAGLAESESMAVPAAVNLPAQHALQAIRTVKLILHPGNQGYTIDVEYGQTPLVLVSRGWLRQRGYVLDKLVAIMVRGQSMQPSLHEGDLVVLNTDDIRPKDGYVFAINYEGELDIKRLRRDAGEWWLCSDNFDQRAYGPKRCTDDVTLIGRLVLKQTEHI